MTTPEDEKERIKRPKLERTEPIRSWSALLGVPGAGGGDGRAPGSASLEGVVSRSVELGYRVVEDYLRQGQRVAAGIVDRSYAPGAMVRDSQELTTRMARYAGDLDEIWFQMIELAASGGAFRGAPFWPARDNGRAPDPPPAARDPSPPAGPHAGEPVAGAARVTVALASTQPAEVTLDLRPGAAAQPLIVQSLRATEPDKPRLTDVTLRPADEDEVLTLRVRVPDGQPPGVYNGLIIDERTSRPVGTLSVRVGPPP